MVYKFIVLVLLLKVGLGAEIAVRDADLQALLVPAIGAAVAGVAIVLLGAITLARQRGVSQTDGLATAGMFGAVSASTLAAGMAILDEEQISYHGYIGALYPFMDVAALVTAIVLARLGLARKAQAAAPAGDVLTMQGGPDAAPQPAAHRRLKPVRCGASLSTCCAARRFLRCWSAC